MILTIAGLSLALAWHHRPHMDAGRPRNPVEFSAWAEAPGRERALIHTLPIHRWFMLSYRHSWMIGFVQFDKRKQ